MKLGASLQAVTASTAPAASSLGAPCWEDTAGIHTVLPLGLQGYNKAAGKQSGVEWGSEQTGEQLIEYTPWTRWDLLKPYAISQDFRLGLCGFSCTQRFKCLKNIHTLNSTISLTSHAA